MTFWTIAGWTAVAALGTFAAASPFLIRWLNRAETMEALVSSVTCQRCRPGGMGPCSCTDPRKCGHPACGDQPGPCERCFYDTPGGVCTCTTPCTAGGCLREDWWTE